MGMPRDLAVGRAIVAYFRPFVEDLVQRQVSRRTLRKHANNLWLLGSEIIRQLNMMPTQMRVPIERLVLDAVGNGGPIPFHIDSEEELRSFESTCRKFERFLAASGQSMG